MDGLIVCSVIENLKSSTQPAIRLLRLIGYTAQSQWNYLRTNSLLKQVTASLFGPPTDFNALGRQFAKELLNDCICSVIIKQVLNWMNSVFLFIYLHIAPPGYGIIDSRTQSSQVCVQLMLSRLCSASVCFFVCFFCLFSFLFVIEHMMPLCMVISWVYSVAMMIQHIVAEKEQRLKEVRTCCSYVVASLRLAVLTAQ